MGLLELSKEDIEDITSDIDGGWAAELTLTSPGGDVVVVNGLHTKHHFGVEPQLQKLVNTKNAHISVSEKFLVDAGYPVRDSENEVNLSGHLVMVKDSTGSEVTYRIEQWFPDETIGLITCILGDFTE